MAYKLGNMLTALPLQPVVYLKGELDSILKLGTACDVKTYALIDSQYKSGAVQITLAWFLFSEWMSIAG